MYGGELFTEYVRISETELAQIHFANVPEILRKLKFLAEREIIDYEPRRDKPQLTFLTPRYDSSLLPLNVFEIQKKKDRDLQKAQAVIRYASHTKRCRTLLLLEYFHEYDAEECGVCDICIQNRKNETMRDAIGDADLAERIIAQLHREGPMLPAELSQAFENLPGDMFLKALQELIQEEAIHYNEQGMLIPTNKTQP